VSTKLKRGPRNLLTSLILVFPLFLIYQIGVLFTLPLLNGADFLTVLLFRKVGLTTTAYLGYTALVTVLFAVAVGVLRRRQRFDPGVIVPVFIESAIYALTMGSLIVLVMTKVFGISPQLAVGTAVGGGGGGGGGLIASQGLLTRAVMSIGAGVYEETVFRLLLLGGIAWLLERGLGLTRWLAVGVAFVVSSLLFSAMHHIPPYGDPLHLGVFTFRFLAGLCFAALFWFRGFAVAVYAHALYDLYVLLVR
jgi:membrane protease YdiL (CAAX protease family)